MTKILKLEEGRRLYLQKLASGEITKQDPIEKAKANPNSLRAAINAKCYDCCCFERTEITLCSAVDCPLYNLRPYQKKEN